MKDFEKEGSSLAVSPEGSEGRSSSLSRREADPTSRIRRALFFFKREKMRGTYGGRGWTIREKGQ